MLQRLAVLLPVLLLAVPARAGPAEDGWERFDAVPTWVTEPPVAEGMFRAVDVGLSNLLHLAYDPERVLRDRLSLRWEIELRLRRLLGSGAREPALAGARAASVVRKGYHFKRARDPEVVGGQVYYSFVLWETPLAAVLAVIPEAQRDAAVVALRAQFPVPPWTEVEAEPAWAGACLVRDGMFVAVFSETADRPDVARAVSDLRSRARVRSQIQGRLRFQLGSSFAFAAADQAVSYGSAIERAWTASPAKTWALWAVPVERILAEVPESSRRAVEGALEAPIPPRASTWQAVDREPGWVREPPQWPDHLPYVQSVESEQADVARQQSIRNAEREIHEDLARRLQPVVGYASAEEAARAGARRRAQGAHAIYERKAGPGTARAIGTHLVTAWTLWHIPIEKILEPLDPEHHAAAREALLP